MIMLCHTTWVIHTSVVPLMIIKLVLPINYYSFLSLSLFSLPVWLQQTRIGLSLFDIQGLGFLKESVS